MAFLRNLLATLLGLFIFSFFGLIIIFGIIGAVASSDAVPVVGEQTVLHMKLNGPVVEKTIEDPIQELIGNGPKPIGLLDVLEMLESAKNDKNVVGIYLEPKSVSASYSSLQEIRDALIDFKSSGKFVYAYGEYLSEGEYYLVSAADSIFVNPEGLIEFNGLTAGVTFFKGLFEKLDIEPEIFRVGQFKSFVEPFIRKDMSEENRLQLSELIGSVHDTYLKNVSEVRGISVEELKNISDKMLVRTPEQGVEYGLISKVAYEDEMISMMKTKLGIEQDADINFMSYSNYMKAETSEESSSNKIAVIVANGDIIMGDDDESIGGEKFAREIRNARESKSIKAIVLRVNSPGGSLTASDMIWREIMLTKGVKPIIASMSDVAASGGYFISMPCDTIVAQPNTITGSIGIFGMLFNFGNFMENKLGITTDNVSTGEFSDIMTVTRSLNEHERAIIQKQVEDGYETFTTKAAQGRNMELDKLLEVASGRVWTGQQAYERGLVDVLGSFDDAVMIAAEKANIADDFRVSYYPRQKPLLEKLMSDLSDTDVSIFSKNDQIVTPYLKKIERLQHMQGLQVRLPGDIEIR